MSVDFDVIIVGASIAGSVAAKLLAQSGYQVAIFDKSDFQVRKKPCGEGLSFSGARALQQLGFSIPSCKLPFKGFQLHVRDKEALIQPKNSGGYTIERSILDPSLLEQASISPNLSIYLGQAVTAEFDSLKSPYPKIVCSTTSLTSKILIIADGGSSNTAKALGIETLRHASPRVGVAAHFVGTFRTAPEYVHIMVEDTFELYGTPLHGNRLNLSLLSKMNPGHSSNNVRTLLLNSQIQQPLFDAMGFEGQIDSEPLGRYPLGNANRTSPYPRIFLIGDAAEEFDPIGGMGMTHAIMSAQLMAEAILSSEALQVSQAGNNLSNTLATQRLALAQNAYNQARRKSSRNYRNFTALTYGILRGSRHCPLLLSLASSSFGQSLASNLLNQ